MGHAATHCKHIWDMLQHTCNTRISTRHASEPQHDAQQRTSMGNAATHSNTLQHTQTSMGHAATHSNTLQHIQTSMGHAATHSDTLQHTQTSMGHAATHSNTLQHTHTSMGHAATHSTTLQHIQTSMGHAATHYLQRTNIYGTCKRATAWRRGSSMDKGDSVPSATVHISHKSAS